MSLCSRIGQLARWTGIVAIACFVMASAAQAAGEWKISEQTMTSLEAAEASISGTASEKFKISVAWYASEIECGTLATEAPTKIFKEGTSEAILKLSSCQVLGPPFVSETCKVIEPITLKVAGELLLLSGKTYELFKAPTGKTSLGAVEFKEGTECPLPKSSELKGTFVGETEAGERKEQPLTLSAAVESLFSSDTLSFGTHPAKLTGKSVWALAAGYKGLKWAAEGKESKEEEAKKLEEEEKLMEEELPKGEGAWLKSGATITGNTPINVKAETEGILLTKVGLSKVEILCTEFKFVGANLATTGRVTGKLHFTSPTGCITKLNGSEAVKCKPKSAGAAAGLIETNALEGSLRLNAGAQYFELFPVSGTSFVTLEMGTECALGSKSEVTGKVWVKDGKGEGLVDKVEHLFEIESALTSAFFGGNTITFDGSAWAFLTGANTGQTFAGHV